ncbi:cysteine-rich CWC family protein [Paenibacillus sp. Z6-24]
MNDFSAASREPSRVSSDASLEVSILSHSVSSELSGLIFNEGKDSGYHISADRCPLCGGNNGCAITRQLPPESCWCMRWSIPEHVRSRIPEKQRNQSCICEQCAEVHIRDE